MKRLWKLGHCCQFIVSKVKICQSREFLQQQKATVRVWLLSPSHPKYKHTTRFKPTLKAVAFTPWVLSLLKFALNKTSLVGSGGSLVSLFSARLSSSKLGSFERAPSSISEMRFPVRSILLIVALGGKQKNKYKDERDDIHMSHQLSILVTSIYPCQRSRCCVFL